MSPEASIPRFQEVKNKSRGTKLLRVSDEHCNNPCPRVFPVAGPLYPFHLCEVELLFMTAEPLELLKHPLLGCRAFRRYFSLIFDFLLVVSSVKQRDLRATIKTPAEG